MRQLYKFACLAAFLAILIAAMPAQATADTVKDIAYGTLEKQKLDIYTPRRTLNAPVMIFVHGGGWHFGDKKKVHSKPATFNRAGIIFVSIGYPLLPEHPVETQATSIAKGVAWVHQNIADHGGDPSELHLMGHSAGAHLVSLVALDTSYLMHEGMPASIIQSVTSIDGATLNVPWRIENLEDTGNFAKRMFTQSFGTDKARWQRLSPHAYIKGSSKLPSFLFLVAEGRIVSNLAADGLKAQLLAAGGAARSVIIDGRNHQSINRRMGTWRDQAFAEIISLTNLSPG